MSDNFKRFTETTLTEGGWYFFYPRHVSGGESRYVYLDQDIIDGEYLFCRKYEGTYVGPITPPEEKEE